MPRHAVAFHGMPWYARACRAIPQRAIACADNITQSTERKLTRSQPKGYPEITQSYPRVSPELAQSWPR
eukprot:1553865-Lingulodinium_polyedra.AAC.1